MPATQTPARHRFVLELLHGDRPLPALALERGDFGRAVEATFFDALRAGHFDTYVPPDAVIEPVLSPGSPQAEAFDVVVPLPRGGEQRRRFGADYFANVALRAGAKLAVAGQVPVDATLAYRLAAFADDLPVRKKRGLMLQLEEESPAIPIHTRPLRTAGPVEVWDATAADDFPVVIPRHVLEESVEEARRAPEREVGGVLLGHLCREEETHELFLDVTCLVPCEETESTALSVTFTHKTWARVREVAEWRGEGELIVGWMHSHPFKLCAECPLPVPAECQAKVLFYSEDDEFVMETSFARPFMVGLLAAVDGKIEATLKRVPVRLFGWDGGRVRKRGFMVSE